jgi:hypothetical protein
VLEAERPGRLVFASDDVTAEDRRVYDECVTLPPVGEVEATVAALERIRADEVFYQTEFGLLAGSILAQRRGLVGPTPEVAHRSVNKALCRATLRDAGVPQPRFALARDAREVRGAGFPYPIVLKAVASTLGRLVTKVESDADLDAKVAALVAALPHAPDPRRLAAFCRLTGLDPGCDPLSQFLVEEFAPGPPLEADGLVVGDRVDLFGITEQRVRDGPGFYVEAYLFPADEPGRAAQFALAAVAALGLRDTGFSIEFRGDAVIEVNGRLGEDDGFPDLFRAALGGLPLAKWFRRDASPSAPRGRFALGYVNAYEPGVVRSVPSVPGVTVVVEPGRRLARPGTPEYRAHLAWALASHPASSRAALLEARARLQSARFRIDPAPG